MKRETSITAQPFHIHISINPATEVLILKT